MDGGGALPEIEDGKLSLVFAGASAVAAALKGLPRSACAKVTHLDLTGNNLRKVPDLSMFPKLGTLVLDKNALSGRVAFPVATKLDTLWLNDNKIKKLADVMDDICTAYPKLRYLSLMKNPCVPDYFMRGKDMEDYQHYRYYVLHRCPTLTFLDDQPADAKEKAKAKSVGQYSAVASPKGQGGGRGGGKSSPKGRDKEEEEKMSAAVETVADDSKGAEPQVYLGYSPYIHLSHDSEGNRMISDDHL